MPGGGTPGFGGAGIGSGRGVGGAGGGFGVCGAGAGVAKRLLPPLFEIWTFTETEPPALLVTTILQAFGVGALAVTLSVALENVGLKVPGVIDTVAYAEHPESAVKVAPVFCVIIEVFV